MLRAIGIPARQQPGLLANGESLVAHVWVRYHDGKAFHELDPTNRSLAVSSGHVPAVPAALIAALSQGLLRVSQ